LAESTLRIILELKDKATASLNKFNKGISETGKTLHNAVKGFETLGAAGAAALFTLNKGLDATIGTYIAYGHQVRELSTNLGVSTEETSRLIQVSDDFGISIEEVRTSLQLAAKNGFAPSIENLATLADRLKEMEDPTQRAAELSKIFGRNWAVLNPILAEGGDAIRENAAAIQENLILTEESVAKTREWELALDEWEDRVEAAKIGIGSFLVDGLLPWFDVSEQMPLVLNKMGVEAAEFVAGLPNASQALKEYAESERRIFDASLQMGESLRLGGEAAASFDQALLTSQGLNQMTAQAQAALEANNALVTSFSEVTLASAASGALEELNSALEAGLITQEDYEESVRAIGGEFLELSPHQLTMIIEQSKLKSEVQTTTEAVWGEVAAWKALAQQLQGVSATTLTKPARGGFQHGGSFIVGGQGGADSQTVSFRASPGERVTVSPQTTNNMNLTIQSMADSEDLVGQFAMMKAIVSGAH